MNIVDFLDRLRGFSFFLSNFFIFVAAFLLYKETQRRVLLPVVFSSVLSSFVAVFPWLLLAADSTLSGACEWYVLAVLGIVEAVSWAIAAFYLLRELSKLWAQTEVPKQESGSQLLSEESK